MASSLQTQGESTGRSGSGIRFIGVLGGVALLSLLVGVVLLRRPWLPAPTGPYAVGTSILNVKDGSRGRELVVQIWYPAVESTQPLADYQRFKEVGLKDIWQRMIRTHARWSAPVAQASQPYNILIFGPRWGGQRMQNTALIEDLASHGYVVASVDHPGNAARVLFANGQVLRGYEAIEGPKGEAATAADRIAYWNETLEVWAADDSFVLDKLAAMNKTSGEPLAGHLDTEHAAALGHSFGGSAAMRLCGRDARIKAAVNLDGFTFGALSTRTAAQPVLILDERAVLDREHALLHESVPGTVDDQVDRADNAAVEANFTRFGGLRLYVAGAQHMDFSDQPLLPPLHRSGWTGPIAPARMNTLLREAVRAFLDESLGRAPRGTLHEVEKRFPEIDDLGSLDAP